MDTKNLVRKIVVGTDVLDEMRYEILVVVEVLQEFLTAHDILSAADQISQGEYCIPFSHMQVQWDVCFKAAGQRVVIECTFNPTGLVCYDSDNPKATIPVACVKAMNASLQPFLDRMVTLVPRLETDLQPIIDAAANADDTPIEELSFSVRTQNCLQRLEVSTLGELALRPDHELLNVKGFGRKSLREVREVLRERGFARSSGKKNS